MIHVGYKHQDKILAPPSVPRKCGAEESARTLSLVYGPPVKGSELPLAASPYTTACFRLKEPLARFIRIVGIRLYVQLDYPLHCVYSMSNSNQCQDYLRDLRATNFLEGIREIIVCSEVSPWEDTY